MAMLCMTMLVIMVFCMRMTMTAICLLFSMHFCMCGTLVF
jgi:hypothetical protein